MSKVSVVVPVYNVEKYLDECISSICASTLYDIEILLIDDGSTDASGDIAEQWQRRDRRVKVYHKTNGGLSDARNYGIQLCQGEYIAFVDSDDKIAPEMFEDMYRACKQDGTKISICGVYLWNPELNKTKRVLICLFLGTIPLIMKKCLISTIIRHGESCIIILYLKTGDVIFRGGGYMRILEFGGL